MPSRCFLLSYASDVARVLEHARPLDARCVVSPSACRLIGGVRSQMPTRSRSRTAWTPSMALSVSLSPNPTPHPQREPESRSDANPQR